MASTMHVFALVATAFFLAVAAQDIKKVPVTVYYESLCPDSIKFFTNQLYKAWSLPLASYMNLTLIPYGKSTTVKNETGYTFTCHHGPNECYGNKVQACALKEYSSQSDQVKFISCAMAMVLNSKSEPYPGKQCASSLGLSYDHIQHCADSSRGDDLLAALGNKTREYSNDLPNVPTVIFNNRFSADDQVLATKNFQQALCQHIDGKKPKECTEPNSAAAVSASLLTAVISICITSM